MSAAEKVVEGRHEDAVNELESLLLRSERGPAGWLVPIEPLFRPLTASSRFGEVLQRLAERAA